jgi:hypothetical protein
MKIGVKKTTKISQGEGSEAGASLNSGIKGLHEAYKARAGENLFPQTPPDPNKKRSKK